MSGLKHAYTKLSAARTRLILEHPFIGALVMHLPLEPASERWCDTVATDARAFYFNAAYIARLDFMEVQFVLAHEALHCALGHFARRAHRTVHRWDVACDHAVNLLLVDEGLKPPPGALIDPKFRALSAEEIYPLLPPDTVERTLDRHLTGEAGAGGEHGRGVPADLQTMRDAPGLEAHGESHSEDHDTWDDAGNERRLGIGRTSAPHGLSPDERESLATAWQSRLAAAAQRTRHAGRLSSSWMRLIEEIIQPQLPWRVLLARYMTIAAREDYSYQRLSRREGNALLPRLASGEVDVFIALDTSGSISDSELAVFAAEVDALKGQIRARVTLMACDERLDERGPWIFQPWEPVLLPGKLDGGGGTSFVPVFDWISREQYRPHLLLYFTDAEGDFPRGAPEYPVVWLVKGKGAVPWGERIQLN